MNFLVMGAGALGSAIGGMLAEAGHDVTLIGRERYMAPIRERGLLISGIWGTHHVKNMRVLSEPDVTCEPEVVLLTTKSFDTERAVQAVQPLIADAPDAVVISLQNGIGNEERIARHVGANRTLGGMIITGFERPQPGEVNVTVSADSTKIGELGNEITSRVIRIVAVFNEAGIPSDAVDNIQTHIWAKALYSAALNPLSAIFGVTYGALAQPHAFAIIDDIIHEAFAVAQAENVTLFWDRAEDYLEHLRHTQIPQTETHHSSMLNDIKRGRRTEIAFLNGVFVELGKKHHIPTPVNETIVREITVLETLGNC